MSKRKYLTEEERKIANNAKAQRYYKRNKSNIKRKRREKYAGQKNTA